MLSDLRFALRQLAKTPGFTLVVVLSLALGIGANTTVLSWIRHVLHEPLPGVARQHEVAVLIGNEGGGNISLLDSRDQNTLTNVFAGVAVSQITPASLVIDRAPEWIYGQIASANFFDLLGVKPILGRTFLPDEDLKPGGNPVVVLGENLWRRRFAANPDIIGRVIDLNRHAFTVIGVVPAEFQGTMTGLACEFWAPVSMVREIASWPEDYITWRGSRPFHNVVRLLPGVTFAQAQAAIDGLDAHLARTYPRSNRNVHHRIARYADAPFGAQSVLGSALRLLLAVSLGVLLIVAANVASLLLARGASRQKELAIRLAAGASRARLIRLMLCESLLLALAGGALGVLFASWAVDGLRAFVPVVQMPVSLRATVDPATLALTLGLSLAAAFAIGCIPAWQVSNPKLYDALKEGGRTSGSGAAHHRLREFFVVSEIALALVLLVGAALCAKGFRQAREIDIGLNPDRVLIAGLQIGMNGYTETTGQDFYRRLEQRLAALPEVERAAFSTWFPLGLAGCKGHGVDVEGYDRPPGENPTVDYVRVSSGYFETLQVPLFAGRAFTDADDVGAPEVAIVNEQFARHYWPGQDALGRSFRVAGRPRTVVGVAKTGKYNTVNEAPKPFFYLPYRQGTPELDLAICVRTKTDPAALVEKIRQGVRALDPGVDLWGAMPLAAHVQGALFGQRLATTLLNVLSLVALVLAAMGVYAVMAYAVSQRIHEFGVRIALGATPADVIKQVLRRGLTLAAAGVAIGLILALATSGLLAGFLQGVSRFDPPAFLITTALLVAATLLACWLPARRATRVNPIDALRAE